MCKLKLMMIVSLVLLSRVDANAQKEGGHGGNGGEYTAMEFSMTARNIFDAIYDRKIDVLFNWRDLEYSLRSSQVIATCEVLKDEKSGVNKDAQNWPRSDGRGLIKFNIDSWIKFRGKSIQKAILVLHEYLSVANLEPSDEYFFSSDAIQKLIAAKVNIDSLIAPVIGDDNQCKLVPLSGVWSCNDGGFSLRVDSSESNGEAAIAFEDPYHDSYSITYTLEDITHEYANPRRYHCGVVGDRDALRNPSYGSLNYISNNKIEIDLPGHGYQQAMYPSGQYVRYNYHWSGRRSTIVCTKN